MYFWILNINAALPPFDYRICNIRLYQSTPNILIKEVILHNIFSVLPVKFNILNKALTLFTNACWRNSTLVSDELGSNPTISRWYKARYLYLQRLLVYINYISISLYGKTWRLTRLWLYSSPEIPDICFQFPILGQITVSHKIPTTE